MIGALTRAEVRSVDQRAIEELGLPGIVLMENAARGAVEILLAAGGKSPVVVCAGKGNNGGDGFAMARHLENRGFDVTVDLFANPDELQGDAAVNYHILQRSGTPIRQRGQHFTQSQLLADWSAAVGLVDALLGTGVRGEVREPYAAAIATINNSAKNVLSVDLPSGLDCDTGESLGVCVRAHCTATFVARKIGFDRPSARAWTGEVHVVDIGIPLRRLREWLSEDEDPSELNAGPPG